EAGAGVRPALGGRRHAVVEVAARLVVGVRGVRAGVRSALGGRGSLGGLWGGHTDGADLGGPGVIRPRRRGVRDHGPDVRGELAGDVIDRGVVAVVRVRVRVRVLPGIAPRGDVRLGVVLDAGPRGGGRRGVDGDGGLQRHRRHRVVDAEVVV